MVKTKECKSCGKLMENVYNNRKYHEEKSLFSGSAFGDGTDWTMRNIPSVLAQSVSRILPSGASNFNP